ncbi:MAG TPA: MFS transporter [Clostridiales bacterium]|nr:MFS transporter [Clostridiales bacterium]
MRIKLYSLILFLNSYIAGLLVPVLSLLLMEKGATLSNISVIMGIYAFTVIIFELPSGIIADLMGRKKTFCLSLIMSLIFSAVIFGGHGFLILCIGISVYGLSRALSSGSFEALFIDSYINEFGKDKLHNITTRLNVLDAMGLSAGALTGGFFPDISKNYCPSLGVYDLNLIVRIILTIAVIILAVVFVTEKSVNHEKKQISLSEHIKNSLNTIIKNKNIICIFISVFSTGFFLSTLEVYWQPHFILLMSDDGLMMLLGVMAFLYLGAAMAGNIISCGIIKKFSQEKMYLVLRLLLVVALVTAALQTNIISFIIFYTLIYLVFGMANIPEGVILNREIPNESRASVLSLNSLITQVGMLMGSFSSSVIINYVTIPELWIISACIVLISVMIIYKKLICRSYEKVI